MAHAHGNKVQVTIGIDRSTEDRIHDLRGSGRNVKAFAAVAREAIERGLELLEASPASDNAQEPRASSTSAAA